MHATLRAEGPLSGVIFCNFQRVANTVASFGNNKGVADSLTAGVKVNRAIDEFWNLVLALEPEKSRSILGDQC